MVSTVFREWILKKHIFSSKIRFWWVSGGSDPPPPHLLPNYMYCRMFQCWTSVPLLEPSQDGGSTLHSRINIVLRSQLKIGLRSHLKIGLQIIRCCQMRLRLRNMAIKNNFSPLPSSTVVFLCTKTNVAELEPQGISFPGA
jgi:hypothetical protein